MGGVDQLATLSHGIKAYRYTPTSAGSCVITIGATTKTCNVVDEIPLITLTDTPATDKFAFKFIQGQDPRFQYPPSVVECRVEYIKNTGNLNEFDSVTASQQLTFNARNNSTPVTSANKKKHNALQYDVSYDMTSTSNLHDIHVTHNTPLTGNTALHPKSVKLPTLKWPSNCVLTTPSLVSTTLLKNQEETTITNKYKTHYIENDTWLDTNQVTNIIETRLDADLPNIADNVAVAQEFFTGSCIQYSNMQNPVLSNAADWMDVSMVKGQYVMDKRNLQFGISGEVLTDKYAHIKINMQLWDDPHSTAPRSVPFVWQIPTANFMSQPPLAMRSINPRVNVLNHYDNSYPTLESWDGSSIANNYVCYVNNYTQSQKVATGKHTDDSITQTLGNWDDIDQNVPTMKCPYTLRYYYDGDTSLLKNVDFSCVTMNHSGSAQSHPDVKIKHVVNSSATTGTGNLANRYVDVSGQITNVALNRNFAANPISFVPKVKRCENKANKTVLVTVAAKSSGGNAYFFGGVERDSLATIRGTTITFDTTDSTNGSHPFKLSSTNADSASGTEYTDGVTYYINGSVVNGSVYVSNYSTGAASGFRGIRWTVPLAVSTTYYYCTAHSGMGENGRLTSTTAKTDLITDYSDVSSGLVVEIPAAHIWHMPTDLSFVGMKYEIPESGSQGWSGTYGWGNDVNDISGTGKFTMGLTIAPHATHAQNAADLSYQVMVLDFSGGYFPTNKHTDWIYDISTSFYGKLSNPTNFTPGDNNVKSISNYFMTNNRIDTAADEQSLSKPRRIYVKMNSSDQAAGIGQLQLANPELYMQIRLKGPNNKLYYINKDISPHIKVGELQRAFDIDIKKATGTKFYDFGVAREVMLSRDRFEPYEQLNTGVIKSATISASSYSSTLADERVAAIKGAYDPKDDKLSTLHDMSINILFPTQLKNGNKVKRMHQLIVNYYHGSAKTQKPITIPSHLGFPNGGRDRPAAILDDVRGYEFLLPKTSLVEMPNLLSSTVAVIDISATVIDSTDTVYPIPPVKYGLNNVQIYVPPQNAIPADVSSHVFHKNLTSPGRALVSPNGNTLAKSLIDAAYTIAPKKISLVSPGYVNVKMDTDVSLDVMSKTDIIKQVDFSWNGTTQQLVLGNIEMVKETFQVGSKNSATISFELNPSVAAKGGTVIAPATYLSALTNFADISATVYESREASAASRKVRQLTWKIPTANIDWLNPPTARNASSPISATKLDDGPMTASKYFTTREDFKLKLCFDKKLHPHFPGENWGQIHYIDMSYTRTLPSGKSDGHRVSKWLQNVAGTSFQKATDNYAFTKVTVASDGESITLDMCANDFSWGTIDKVDICANFFHTITKDPAEVNTVKWTIDKANIESNTPPVLANVEVQKIKSIKYTGAISKIPIPNLDSGAGAGAATDFSFTVWEDCSLVIPFTKDAFGGLYLNGNADPPRALTASDVIEEAKLVFKLKRIEVGGRVDDHTETTSPCDISFIRNGTTNNDEVEVGFLTSHLNGKGFIDHANASDAVTVQLKLWKDRNKTTGFTSTVNIPIQGADISFYMFPAPKSTNTDDTGLTNSSAANTYLKARVGASSGLWTATYANDLSMGDGVRVVNRGDGTYGGSNRVIGYKGAAYHFDSQIDCSVNLVFPTKAFPTNVKGTWIKRVVACTNSPAETHINWSKFHRITRTHNDNDTIEFLTDHTECNQKFIVDMSFGVELYTDPYGGKGGSEDTYTLWFPKLSSGKWAWDGTNPSGHPGPYIVDQVAKPTTFSSISSTVKGVNVPSTDAIDFIWSTMKDSRGPNIRTLAADPLGLAAQSFVRTNVRFTFNAHVPAQSKVNLSNFCLQQFNGSIYTGKFQHIYHGTDQVTSITNANFNTLVPTALANAVDLSVAVPNYFYNELAVANSRIQFKDFLIEFPPSSGTWIDIADKAITNVNYYAPATITSGIVDVSCCYADFANISAAHTGRENTGNYFASAIHDMSVNIIFKPPASLAGDRTRFFNDHVPNFVVDVSYNFRGTPARDGIYTVDNANIHSKVLKWNGNRLDTTAYTPSSNPLEYCVQFKLPKLDETTNPAGGIDFGIEIKKEPDGNPADAMVINKILGGAVEMSPVVKKFEGISYELISAVFTKDQPTNSLTGVADASMTALQDCSIQLLLPADFVPTSNSVDTYFRTSNMKYRWMGTGTNFRADAVGAASLNPTIQVYGSGPHSGRRYVEFRTDWTDVSSNVVTPTAGATRDFTLRVTANPYTNLRQSGDVTIYQDLSLVNVKTFQTFMKDAETTPTPINTSIEFRENDTWTVGVPTITSKTASNYYFGTAGRGSIFSGDISPRITTLDDCKVRIQLGNRGLSGNTGNAQYAKLLQHVNSKVGNLNTKKFFDEKSGYIDVSYTLNGTFWKRAGLTHSLTADTSPQLVVNGSVYSLEMVINSQDVSNIPMGTGTRGLKAPNVSAIDFKICACDSFDLTGVQTDSNGATTKGTTYQTWRIPDNEIMMFNPSKYAASYLAAIPAYSGRNYKVKIDRT